MASATNTAKDESFTEPHTWWLWRRADQAGGKRHLSPIVLRILAVNVMALAILVGSLLYLGRYQDKIIATELNSLLMQSRIISSAVVEGAIVIDENDKSILSPLLSRLMVRRLAETTETRTRLFDRDNTLLADSRALLGSKKPQTEELSTTEEPRPNWIARFTAAVFDVIDLIHTRRTYPFYEEREIQRADQYEIAQRAMQGEVATQVWSTPKTGLILAVAVPVEHYGSVLGAVMMSRSDAPINKAIYAVRIDILRIFFITLLITVLLSLYLARAIARPIRLLALAAEGLRHGQMQIVGLAGMANLLTREAIPDMTDRKDEIGDLSGALRDLTTALAQRIGAIENFAADVAHEIKNPLTSLRSAVETVERIQDPARQKQLMAVIRDDVDRLDRLITDIASASRLDAELSRDEMVSMDIGRMLTTLADFHHQSSSQKVRLMLDPLPKDLRIEGVEARLVQVLQNLIDNAMSFSPPGGIVKLAASRQGRYVQVTVEDSGPGIPENKLEAIFDRFYSERPKTEKFGTHSGLGLSISKQIVEAHRGRIRADNRRDGDGTILGARFVVMLPASDG
ncbi:MAG: stimulus-sensing domain-containing protein [Alphaproteobacteria bacterium]|nr:stimulus-sensing domain-containing protein [Alphaproteobacteria bacterium]